MQRPKNSTGAVTYPNKIGYCIKKYGYTYTEVADEIGVARRTLSYYISGERAAPRYCLEKIARLLGCDVEELIGAQTSSIILLTDEQKKALSNLLSRNNKLLTEEQKDDATNMAQQLALQQILGAPEASYLLSPTAPSSTHQSRVINEEFIAILESDLAARWELYHTAGAARAWVGLDIYIKEMAKLSRSAQDTPWYPQMQTLLTTGYQLQSCVLRDLMEYRQSHIAYQKAFDSAQELNDPELMASSLQREGVTLIQQDKPKEAIIYLTGALNIIDGYPFPTLRVHIFQALSEANAKASQEQESWACSEQAEEAQAQQGQGQEHSLLRRVAAASIAAQKGVNTVLLHDHHRAIALIDQSLKTYDPSIIRGRARVLSQRAEAFLGLGILDACLANAQEALSLARTAGSNRTIARVNALYATLTESPWRKEQGVIQLGMALLAKNEESS